MSFSSNPLISTNTVRGQSGLEELTYGEYPQSVAEKNIMDSLERTYSIGQLIETGKEYTVDSKKYNEFDQAFSAIKLKEYEYNGKKYVRVKASSCYDGGEFTLSNGEKYKDGDYVWVEVEPIVWFKEPNENFYVSKRCLFAGIRFDKENGNYNDSKFNATEINTFLQTNFAAEIVASQNLTYQDFHSNTNEIQPGINPYDFDFENVSEEDIINASLESGLAVFLHGRSSEGKSARVKQRDPDCEIIYLRNVTPDSLNGKSIAITDQSIIDKLMPLVETGKLSLEEVMRQSKKLVDVKPTWLENLEEKCKKEPDKLHIVFFDEITNALPSIQGMAYNIILDREVNGKWKLPDNARVVAAGNEMKDSLAANQLAEPLFNRFVHVYIQTTLNSWLKWAIKANIHPAIIKFVSYGGERVLRSEYNGKTPNADPRKWEMASKMLYSSNNPMLLRGLIGVELTNEFCAFCKMKLVTLDDVLNDNYDESVFSSNISIKAATVIALCEVDIENVEKVRDFVCKLGNESVRLFDSLWIKDDASRKEKIALLRLENQAISFEGGVRK